MKIIPVLLLAAGAIAAGSGNSVAQTTEPTTSPPPAVVTTGSGGSSQVEGRLVSQFSSFAGSEDNARSLVTGLRQGSEITLGTTASGGGQPAPGTTTTFTPPTRPMGYGNVRITLALAQEQLSQAGITQPTPAQLQTALMGGTITNGTGSTAPASTQMSGVLQMRADGMGWGQIANSMGVKLGTVMSGRTTAPAPAGTSTQTSGITTAAGATAAATQANGRGHAAAPGQQQSRAGSGIVNAAGGTNAGYGASTRGGGGAGVMTGANMAAGSRASATGMANGKGHAKP
jgi:hypothetical protein